MQVYLTDNVDGYAIWYDSVRYGMTIREFITVLHPDMSLRDLTVRVNNRRVESKHLLNQNDHISITPYKLDGD